MGSRSLPYLHLVFSRKLVDPLLGIPLHFWVHLNPAGPVPLHPTALLSPFLVSAASVPHIAAKLHSCFLCLAAQRSLWVQTPSSSECPALLWGLWPGVATFRMALGSCAHDPAVGCALPAEGWPVMVESECAGEGGV